MKKLYTSPQVTLIGYLASEKNAADGDWDFGNYDIALSSGSTPVSDTDIKIPIKG